MPRRRPFSPTNAVAGGDGQPATTMSPQPGVMPAQPPMGMGGTSAMMGANMRGADQGNPSPGGPTSPLNIGQMLQAQMMSPDAGRGARMPAGAPMSMPPWGDQGTRPSAPTPSRVPFQMPQVGTDAGLVEGESAGMPTGAMSPMMLLQLLRSLGRV